MSILMTSPFSDSIVFFFHTRKQRFQKASFNVQIAPPWRAFSNRSVFGAVVWTIAVSSCKTAPFLFENGLVWTGPQKAHLYSLAYSYYNISKRFEAKKE